MRSYPIPFNELSRLTEIEELQWITPDKEPLLDEIVEIVCKEVGVPTALVSIVDEDKQWFAARENFAVGETSRDFSICAHAILTPEPLVICDALSDQRFCQHPVVVNPPYVRFYAGVPIVLSSGLRVGSLCAIDYAAREHPTSGTMATLKGLARITAKALERTTATLSSLEGQRRNNRKSEQSTFIALIGHELRTPLTILFGSLQMLEATAERGINPTLIRSARKSAKHLIGLVETIIAYSDAATGELRLNEQISELDELVGDVAELILPGMDGTLKSVSLDGELPAVSLQVDPDQIKLALNALALNAINHGGATVTIGGRLDDQGNVEISIVDDGSIDENIELSTLYKPFVVGGDIDTRDTMGGLGLGLPLTRKLIELHGGEFEVQTTANCTSAIIRLPASRVQDKYLAELASLDPE